MASTHTIDAVPPSVERDLHAETATPDHGSGGLPQFQFEHWAGQIGYLLILFAILYLLVSKVFAPRLRRVMDERAETISTAVSTARQVQAQAAEQAAAANGSSDNTVATGEDPSPAPSRFLACVEVPPGHVDPEPPERAQFHRAIFGWHPASMA